MKFRLLFGFVLFSVLLFTSCEIEEVLDADSSANVQLYNLMKEEYLWYDKVPDVDPLSYSSPYKLMTHLRYDQIDKWSFVMGLTDYNMLMENSSYVGYGFGIARNSDGKFYVSLIFKNSPAYPDGVRRGWQITHINDTQLSSSSNINSLLGENKAGVSNKFGFKKPDGEVFSNTYIKRDIVMNTIVYDNIYTVNNNKIGYFVFHEFLKQSESELEEVFVKFKVAGITSLIVDLRYNGGGSLGVAEKLANLIAGANHSEKIFGKLMHNDKNRDKDSKILISKDVNSLNLEKVVFITSGSSASASEVLINGLKPLMPVTLIGEKTHGKPVGMYVYQFENYVFAPVCFKMVNKDDMGDFFSGLPVNYEVFDNVERDFGDLEEARLKAAIEFIRTGSVESGRVIGKDCMYYPDYSGTNMMVVEK
jgi:hypothetical protein